MNGKSSNRPLVKIGLKSSMKRTCTLVSLTFLGTFFLGCSEPLTTREKGAGIGTLAGASLGGVIGSATGHAGAGAGIGAAIGLIGGALIGDQVQERQRQQQELQKQMAAQQAELERVAQELQQLKQLQQGAAESGEKLMSLAAEPGADQTEAPSGLVTLGLLSLLAGGVAGLVAALFRLALDHADSFRNALVAWAHGWQPGGLLFVVAGCAGAVAVAALLVRRYSPYASGSGIPHVELVLKGELRQAPYRLIWVKFFGGLLAIGSGLALGREGPSVQMGASLANLLGEAFRRNGDDCKALLAAGAGAGLATAFNAPIGGAVFVLEELTRRFDTRVTIATLGASAGAIAVARVLLGDTPDFQCRTDAVPRLRHIADLPGTGHFCGMSGSCVQPCNSRYACGRRKTPWLAGRSAGRGYRRGGGTSGVVSSRLDRRGRRNYPAGSLRYRDCSVGVGGFFGPFCAWPVVLCSGNARGIVRPHPCLGSTKRLSPGEFLLPMVSFDNTELNGACRRRHGGIFHCRRSRAADRHHSSHRDDRQFHPAFADAGRLLRGHAGANPDAQRAHL